MSVQQFASQKLASTDRKLSVFNFLWIATFGQQALEVFTAVRSGDRMD